MNHLEAFMSEDAKRGRIWRRRQMDFKRDGLYVLWATSTEFAKAPHIAWTRVEEQVAALEGEVRWADEPEKMTLPRNGASKTVSQAMCTSRGGLFIHVLARLMRRANDWTEAVRHMRRLFA